MSELTKHRLRKWTRISILLIVLGTGVTAFYLNAIAVVQNWNFSTSADYTCEGIACPSTNIQVDSGDNNLAELVVRADDFVHDSQIEFSSGTYDGAKEGETEWSTDHVRIKKVGPAPETTRLTVTRRPLPYKTFGNDILVYYNFDEASTSQVFADVIYDNVSGDASDDDALRGSATSPDGRDPASPTSSISTAFGNELQFNSDYITADYGGTGGDYGTLNVNSATYEGPNDNITVSFWFNSPNTGQTTAFYTEGGGTNGFAIYMEGDDLECAAWSDAGAAGGMNLRAQALDVLFDDTWFHVACVFDSGSTNGVELYLDGVNVASGVQLVSGDTIEQIPAHTGDTSICFTDQSSGGYFNDGVYRSSTDYCRSLTLMDDFAYWKHSLTAGEVRDIATRTDPWNIWHLNETTTPFLDSGNNDNRLTNENAVTDETGQTGMSGAQGFNGSTSYIDSAASPTFDTTDALTLQAWIYPTTLPASSNEDFIISSNNATNEFSLSIEGQTGGEVYLKSDWGGQSVTGMIDITSTATWYHVAAVWNHGRVTLFVDGVPEQFDYSGSLTVGEGANVRIGNDSGGTNAFNGRLDEVLMMTRGATDSEIVESAGAFEEVATYQSPSLDASVSKPWNRFRWTEDEQYGPPQPGQTNLVHLYSLDEATPLDSEGSIDMTSTGTVRLFSRWNRGHYFDAANDRLVTDSALASLSAFTIEFWVRFEDAIPAATETLLSIGTDDPTIERNTSGQILVSSDGTLEITSTKTIEDTRWHHIAIAYNSSNNLSLYIDGVLDTNDPQGGASEAAVMYLGDAGSNEAFLGHIDEVQVFDAELNAATIASHYKAQKYVLKFLTRSCNDSACAGENWIGDDGSDMLVEDLFTGSTQVAYWHFDEDSYDGSSGEAVDLSFNDNDGTADFASTVQGGLIKRAVAFNGDDEFIAVDDDSTLQIDPSLANIDLSIEAWLFMNESQKDNATIVAKRYEGAGTASVSYALEMMSDQRLQMRLGDSTNEVTYQSNTVGGVPVGEWAHVLAVYDGSQVEFYINGEAHGTNAETRTLAYDSEPLYIGDIDPEDVTRNGYKGKIDLLVIYNDDQGGNAATNFAKNDPYNFKGNESDTSLQEDVNNRFFQYKAFFYSDGGNTPEMNTVLVRNSTFSTLDPYIENASPWAYDTMSGFTETPGGSNASSFRYVLKDGAGGSYKYWDTSQWSNSDLTWDQANTAADINTNIGTFPAGGANGRIYWRALIRTDGEQLGELDNLSFTIAERLDVTGPAGQTFDVDDVLDITWTYTGDPVNVDIEWTTGSGNTSLANDVAVDGATNGCTDPGTFAGCWRGTVPDAISSTFQVVVTQSGVPAVTDTGGNNTVNGKVQVNAPGAITTVVEDTLLVQWVSFGTIGVANDTQITLDSIYAGSNFTAPGVTSIATNATNDDNGFGCSVPAVTAPQYGGCYEFTVPDGLSAGADARIRITEGSWSDESVDFTITGSITMVKPAASDVWLAESDTDETYTQTYVEWTPKGSIGTLILEFDETGAFSGGERIVATGLIRNSNNGTGCTPAGSNGCYVLSGSELPRADETTVGDVARFRLRAVGPNPDVESSSEPQFEVRGWFEFTAPINSTSWNVSSGEAIQWATHGDGMGNIDLHYRETAAGGWNPIVTNILDADGDSNSYTWPSLPVLTCDEPGGLGCSEVAVRITENDGGPAERISQEFTVLPVLTVTEPGATTFTINDNSPANIQWTRTGSFLGNVDIYYSTDEDWGSACTPATGAGKCFVCTTAATNDACTWATVPDTPSLTVKFRAEANLNTAIFDTTTNNTSIHGNFTVDLPPCAPNCVSEGTHNITYTETTGSANIANVAIYYSTNDFTSATLIDNGPKDLTFDGIGAGDDGPWFIPQNIIHDNVKIRVSDLLDANFDSAGMSGAFNTVVGLRLIAPNGTEEWTVGTPQDIQWGYTGTMNSIGIFYCTDGTITCGSPGTIVASFNARNIVGCTSPTPGPNESIGCFKWQDGTTTGVGDVRSDQVRVFLRDVDTNCNPDNASCGTRPTVDDGADADHLIMPALTLVSPSASNLKIDAATAYTVEWDSQGTPLANVELFYANDGVGGTYNNAIGTNPHNNTTQAAPPTSPNNSYSWTTPSTVSTGSIKYAVRVQDPDTVDYPNAADNSDNEFDLVARFDPTAPAGGEDWRVLTNQTLNWTPAGDVTNVQIQYSNDLIAWTTIVQDSPTQGESATTATGIFANASRPFTWKVPNVAFMINGNVKIRLLDADTGHILRDTPVESNAFNVLANISVFDPPVATEKWRETQTRVIRWYMKGHNADVFTVDLEYDEVDSTFSNAQLIKLNAINGINTDNGGCLLLGGGAPDEDEGCYAWSIPASLVDSDVWVRVKDSDSGNPDSTAIAGNGVSASFEVLQSSTVNVESPDGSTFAVDDVMDIVWSGTGDIQVPGRNVEIRYTTNGTDYTSLANVDADFETGGCSKGAHLGCYRTNAPDEISTTFQIEVRDQSDAEIFDLSADNTINGDVNIVAPTPGGGSTFVVGDTLTIQWIVFGGTIGLANDTTIEIDTNYAGSNFSNPGLATITTSATNDANGFGCSVPVVTAPQYGGCYEYTLLDTITNAADMRVRVTDGSWSATSGDHTVTGRITMTSPAVSEIWKVETATDYADAPIDVEWTYDGSVGTVDLYLDDEGDFSGNERTIITGLQYNSTNGTGCTAPASGGCYRLSGNELPQKDETTTFATNEARFRLKATTPNPDVESTSEPQFEIRGWYDLTSPTNTDLWLVDETTRQVQWETHGEGMGAIDLHYRVDGGSWVAITTSLADTDIDATASHTWPTIPNADCAGINLGCDKVEVRIQQSNSIEDISPDFTIKPQVIITDPAPLNFLIDDTSRVMNWTINGTVDTNVDIYYSTDQNWGNACTPATGAGKCPSTPLCSAAGGSLTCNWTDGVPDITSLDVKFRAEANSDTTVNSETGSFSSFHGQFTADLPPCAPNCFSENDTNISWTETTLSNAITIVKLFYSTNDFGASTLIANTPHNVPPGEFAFDGTNDGGPWTIPENIVHDNVRIRVVDALDTNFDSEGLSASFNSIAELRMITPNGGEEWNVGVAQDLQWGYKGTLQEVDILYCTDGTISCGSPTVIASDVSANNAVGCAVPTPGAGETVGCYNWADATSTGVADAVGTQVRVFIRDSDTLCNPNDGFCTARPKVDDGSDTDVKVQPYLTVVSPSASGLKIDADTSYTLEWDSQGTPLANVELFYSDDGLGGTYDHAVGTNPHSNTTQSAPAASPNNSFSWTTPTTISTAAIKYAVRVQNPDGVDYANNFDLSDNEFEIVARFDPTAPAGGESWMVLTNHNLAWTTAGSVANVQLQYSNDAIGWTTIVQDSPTQGETATSGTGVVANSSPFIWKVPNVSNIINGNVKVRLLDADTGHVVRDIPVESNAFNIVPNIQMIDPPEAGVIWRETQTRVIRWKMVGDNATVSTVDIEYDQVDNTFSSPNSIKVDATHGTNADNGGCTLQGVGPGETEGCFAWAIPGALIDSDVWIRVKDSDVGHPDSTAVTGNGISPSFEIGKIATVTLDEPVGNTYVVDDDLDIIWSATGALADPGAEVYIEYRIDGGSFNLLAQNVDADADTGGCSSGGSLGCIRLKVPDAISGSFQVQIRDQNDTDISNLGGNNTVNGNVVMVAPTPAGGTTYVVGDTLTIQWITFGENIGLANDTVIEFDSNYAGSNFTNPGLTTITSSASNNQNGFGCSVPVVSSPQVGGCYEWTLPDEITNLADMRVRVSDGAFNGMTGNHTLTGSLTFVSPTGADVWKVETANDYTDTPIDVEWTYAGTVGTVDLEFDDAGLFSGSERTIQTGLASNTNNGTGCTAPASGGCYRLSGGEIPQQDETTSGATSAKFRVTAATPEPDVISNVGATPGFEVRGWFNLTAPTNTDTWLVGETTRQVSWETHGDGLGNVDVEYEINGSGTWLPLDNPASVDVNDSDISAIVSYTWSSVVDADCGPLALGCDKVKVRIRQTGPVTGSTILAESQDFTVKPQVLITDPAPLNFLIGDNSRSIAWTTQGTVDTDVDIFYSTDQDWGSSCTPATGAGKCAVCSATQGNFNCAWPLVPDVPNLTVKFRAEANSDNTVNSETATNARIHANFTADLPACAPTCFSEDTTNITWNETTLSNVVTSVKIFYSTNGTAFTLIDTTNNDGAYDGGGVDTKGPWFIPENLVHDNMTIRVVDEFDTALDSAGDSASFETPARLRVITPNGSDIWSIGDVEEIQWGFTGTVANVSIKYCTDGTITCGSPGTIVASVAANNTVGCTSPTPGANETVGCYSWTDATTGGVADDRGHQIRVFLEDIDVDCNPSLGCGTRPVVDDGSDANFKIVNNLAITTPLSSAQLDADTATDIIWDSQGTSLPAVDLIFSDDNATTFANTIELGETNTSVANVPTSNTANPQWTPPADISDTGLNRLYHVRVRDPDTTNFLEANSTVPVDVVAAFSYNQPTGASTYLVGDNYTIDWNTSGNVTNVELQYFTTERGSWTTIIQTGAEGGSPTPDATNVNNEYANDGTFVWQVPNVINLLSAGAKVRVIDGDTGHVLRSSPNESSSFTIIANIQVLAPAGAETLGAGTTYNIQWKTAGTLAAPSTVDIQYDLNSANLWNGTVDTDITNGQNGVCTLPSVSAGETAGCYEWQLHADAIHSDVRFRIVDSDAGHPASTLIATNGVSNSFTIEDNIVILSPNTLNEQLTGGDQYDIKWEAFGSWANVDIQYSNDGFTLVNNDILLSATHDANGTGCILTSPGAGGTAGCYRWDPIDNNVDANYVIRFREDQGPNKEELSAQTFEIVGPLALTYPNGGGGQYFTQGDTLTVTWDNNQTLPIVPFIDLDYSPNNGGNWYDVEDSLGNPATNVANSGAGGNYEWKVPDDIANNYLVRVVENGNPAKGDDSNDNFKVIGSITLSTLQGADDQYAVDEVVPISFTVSGTPQGNLFNDVTIRYSDQSDFSANVVNITTNFLLDHGGPNTNCTGAGVCTFNWTVDDSNSITNTEVYYLQVIDPDQTEAEDSSAQQFQVYGTLTLSAEHPCGVDNLCFIGESPNPDIVFTRAGVTNGSLFDTVDIQYSDDGFNLSNVTIESGWDLDTNCVGNTCTYSWNITEAGNTVSAAASYFIRVIDPNNTISKDTGTTAFEIAGDLSLTTINGGGDAVYQIGDVVSIEFTKNGNASGSVFDDVVIEYSTQNDFSSNVVTIDGSFDLDGVNCPANACTKSWTIDNTHAVTQDPVYYLRVRDPQNADSTTGTSADQFELAGFLDITILNGGGDQVYKVGDNVNITWDKKGNANPPIFDDVTLEYSDDGFGINTILIDTVTLASACSGVYPNETCTYSWTIDDNDPIITSENYQIRIRDPNNTDTVTTSTDSFKIVGDLTLTVLTSSDAIYEISQLVPITWSAEGLANGSVFDNVDIQYSNDGFGSNIANIAIELPLSSVCSGGNCTYNWTVPDPAIITNSADYTIRIRDLDNPSDTVTTSVNQFQLAGYLNLTTQTTSATYTVGSVVPVTFDWNGAAQGNLFNDVNIQYSNNNFVSDFRTVALNQSLVSPQGDFSCTLTDCTYLWTVPTGAQLSSGFIYRMRVMDPDNSDGSTYSASRSLGFFKLAGGFTWVQPTGGATKWSVDTIQTAEWSTVGGINNVKVSYSTDDFLNQTFFEDNAGTLEESVATTFGAASAIANNPNDVPSTTSYPLRVPDAISTNFKLRIYDSIDGTVIATSDVVKVHSLFSVSEPDTTTKISATTYASGIQWSNTGTVNKVKLEYNLGGGWLPVTSAQSGSVTDDAGIINSNPGSINWTTPNAVAVSAQVRVSAGLPANNPDLDTSGLSNNFKLSAKVNLLSPNGENVPFWKVGDTARTITWNTTPATLSGGNTVDILVSTAGVGGPYALVTNGDDTPNDGSFNWNPIPDTISNNVFLRVEDSADSDGFDLSDAAFSIAGDLSITSGNSDAPLGGESWPIYAAAPAALAVSHDVKWTSTGTAMNLVELRASNDGFGSSDVLIATSLANAPGQNTYTWQISDTVVPITTIGSNWQVKVLNITSNTPAEEIVSDGFIIRSGLYMSSHNATDDSCEIGGSCTMNWNTSGLVNDVILEYSTSGPSGPWTRMHGGGTLGSNPGTYNWTVPGALSPGFNARYRVTDAVVGHPVSTDTTDANSRLIAIFPSAEIKIQPSDAVLSGQDFEVGDIITVNYDYVGVVGAINVEISLDEDSNLGTFDSPIEVVSSEPTNGDGTGTFNYQFTDLLAGGKDTTRIRFRILDASVPDDSVNNVTNGVSGTVRLGGAIVVTGPNLGSERWDVGSAQTITWTNLGNSITNVMIEYDDNPGFSSPTTIAAGVPSVAGVGGSHGITVNNTTFPDINTLFHNDIYIRVSDADTAIHGPSNDISDNGHLIIGTLDMSQGTHAPLTGDTWDLSSPHTLTWTTVGNITNVDVYYSHTGLFGDAVKINDEILSGECPSGNAGPCVNNPDADTSVSWTPGVDHQISTTAKIWIEDYDDNTTPQSPTYEVQASSQTFELYGIVTLTAPLLDAQKLKATNQVVFTWNTVGDTLNNVDIEYSRDSAAPFTNPQPIVMNYDNSVGGGTRGTYTWTIPDTFNDDTVFVRVLPRGHTQGFDVSGSFKIMPKIQLLAPSGGEKWEIGTSEDIVWDIKGVVSSIKLRYSVDGGVGFPAGAPYEIITINPNNVPYALTGANAKHTWNDAFTGGVADTRTQQARVKIELMDDPSGDADAEQTVDFTIAARFVLSAPTINEEFQVGDTFNIQWDWGGTITNVVLEYSDTYDGTNAVTFDAGARCMKDHTRTNCTAADMQVTNGVGASGTNYTPPAITVGDDISRPGDPEGEFPYYVRISDPTDPTVFDIFPNGAGNGFKIKSNMLVTSPDLGSEVWFVGNLNYDITWTNTGTVSNVVLEYTKDNWTTPLCVAGGTYPACNAIANSSPYSWQIADDDLLVPHTCNSQPDPNTTDTIHPCKIDTVRVRVKDSGDANVLDASDNDFTARYVAKRWIIRDSTVGTDLDSITMFENTIHKVRAFSNQNVPGIVSPYVIWSPANVSYTIAFQKTGFTDLFDPGQLTTSTDQLVGVGDEMVDEEQTIFLDSIIAHNDVVNTTYEYTAGAPDQIIFTVWYTRDGLNVTTSTGADLHIYDGVTEIITMSTTTQTPPGSGVYEFTVSPTGMVEGVDYEARNTVTLASAALLPGYTIVNITSQSQGQDTSANLAAITPTIQTNLDTSLDAGFTSAIDDVNAAKTTITTAIGDTSTQTLKQKLDDQGVLVDNELTLFETSANDAIAQMQDQIDEAGIRLIIPDTVKIGSVETLRLSTVTAKSPVLDISCPDNTPIFQGLAMTEVDTGLYAVDVNFDSLTFKCAAAKAVTVSGSVLLPSHDINDPAFTATAIGGIFITTTDLDTIQGLAAAGLNAEKAAKEAKEAIENVSKAVTGEGSIVDSLTDLQRTVNRIPMLLGGDKSNVTQMRSTLEEIAGQLNGFMGNDGYDMNTILQQEIAEGMRGIRNSADRTLAASEIMKALVERNLGKSDEPVIETYYEIGSVRLRVVAVNPSGDKSQIVPIKIYLPQEVIPDDIIDMGELQVGFDSARSLYYAFNDGIELAPKETRVFEVHLEDVWRIPDEEMQKVKMQADRAIKFLTGTEFEEKATEIVESINIRLEGIKTKQNDQSISREEHIGAYRVNLLTMQQIRKDIRILEKVLQHAGAPPSIEFLKDTVFETKDDIEQSTVWKIILGIVGFLALLGFGFLFRWFIVIQAQRRTQEASSSDLSSSFDIEEKSSADNRIETIGMPDQDEPPSNEQRKAS